MRKIKVIENPSSGLQQSGKQLSQICLKLLDAGYILQKFKTRQKDDGYYEAIHTHKSQWDMIIVSGGDGTVNEVVNGLASIGSTIPLAIHSRGTVNDFANYMKIPTEVDEFVNMIKDPLIKTIDLGMSDDQYFINIAACGNFANIGHQTDINMKAMLGKFAYVVEGIKELPNSLLEPMKLTIELKDRVYYEEAYLILIANTTIVGGFEKMAPKASLFDGLLDVVIFKKHSNISNFAPLFINVLTGDHIYKDSVLYFQTDYIKIGAEDKTPVDIDGEFNGYLPKVFSVKHKGINIITSQ